MTRKVNRSAVFSLVILAGIMMCVPKADAQAQTVFTKANNLTALNQSGNQPEALYQEYYRPQYHFTAKSGWINDPNGLVYVDGVYHLYFQHIRPATRWGHATSRDLLHWEQQPDAILPERNHSVFSGSAVIDRNNTSGFGDGKRAPIVAAFTSWGEGQCLSYSLDSGMTWTFRSHLPGFYVCPDLFELPVEGEKGKTWVAMDWAQYTTGSFDGEKFTPDQEPVVPVQESDSRAARTSLQNGAAD